MGAAQITFEIGESDRNVLKEAAALSDQSMADFIRTAAGGVADEVIEERRLQERRQQLSVDVDRRSTDRRRPT